MKFDKAKQLAGVIGAGAGAALGVAGLSLVAMKIIKKLGANNKKKAILEDLMKNDPEISRADPSQVIEFFGAIDTINPQITTNRVLIRDILHSSLKFGRLDLATINTLANTYKTTLQNDNSYGMLLDIRDTQQLIPLLKFSSAPLANTYKSLQLKKEAEEAKSALKYLQDKGVFKYDK